MAGLGFPLAGAECDFGRQLERKEKWNGEDSYAFKVVTRSQEVRMSSTTDKAKGYGNEAIGKAKQGIGKAVGSDKMRVEGVAQEAKGKVQVGVGKVKDAAKDGAEAVKKTFDK